MSNPWDAYGPGTTQSTTDVTNWRTYFSPHDAVTVQLLATLKVVLSRYLPGSIECHSSLYSFSDADIEALFEKFASNGNSRFVFDASCCKENEDEAKLVQKLQAVSNKVAIGSSPIHNQILHTKAIALLFPDNTGFTFTGSFNLTYDATFEFNAVDMVWSRSRAELFAGKIDAIYNYVQELRLDHDSAVVSDRSDSADDGEHGGIDAWSVVGTEA